MDMQEKGRRETQLTRMYATREGEEDVGRGRGKGRGGGEGEGEELHLSSSTPSSG